MNKDQLAAEFKNFRSKAKSIWGELTDSDYDKAEGNLETVYATIQAKFGDTKEMILKKLEELTK